MRRALMRAVALGAALIWLVANGAASAWGEPPSAAAPSCAPITYHSAPRLKAQRVCMNLGVTTHGTQPGTYLFVSPGGNTLHTGAGIFQDNGTLVWWQRSIAAEETDLTIVHYLGHPYLAVWSGTSDFKGPYGSGTVSLYNEHYQRVGRITAGRPFAPDRIDSHEFQITPQGDALFGIYEPVSTTFEGHRLEAYQYVVQKVSLIRTSHGIRTGRVLFQWESLNHVPLSQTHIRVPPKHEVWDYFHGNGIAQDSDGNLLVSSRNTWGIYKINVRTGATMWQVGSRGDHTLAQPWCYQHDIVPLGHQRYSLFDDGGNGPGCSSGHMDHPARGVIFEVDASQQPAGVTLVRAQTHDPPLYPSGCGALQPLAGGGTLIGWGNVPEVTQYAPDDAVDMDLSLSNWSYRAFRFAWVGEPATRPSVAAHSTASSTDLWASWNGSTQVVAWRVLAGADSAHLAAVGPATPKRGFETPIVLSRPYRAVAVQALSASGHVLSTSHAIRPTARH